MKLITLFVLPFLMATSWQTDFSKASQQAATEHKFILLSFSGSDWCIPCIKMHKSIFENEAFTTYAAKELVLVNADFPRLKKHQLPAAQQKQNESLADRYNPSGAFPYTVLIDTTGKVVKTWDGNPNISAEAFTGEINSIIHGNK